MRVMKDTWLEWAGEPLPDWTISRLRFLGSFAANGVDKKTTEGEKLFKSVHYMDVYRNSLHEIGNSEDYLIVSAVDNKEQGCTLVEGDVLFTSSSETPEDIGHSVVVYENLSQTLFGYHLMRFRPCPDLNYHYLKYLFGSSYMRSWFSYRAYGMTRYGITYSDFADAIIAFPYKKRQQYLANYLDSRCDKIDHIIEQQQSVIEKLIAYKQSVITEAVTKGLNPNVQMRDSGIEWIGMIPAHWDVRKIGNIGFVTKLAGFEFTEHMQYLDNGEVIAIRGLNLRNFKLDLSNVQTISLDVSYSLPRSKVHIGDILVSYAGTVGAIGLVEDDHEYHLAPNVAKITIRKQNLRFITYYLISKAGQLEIDSYVNKNAQLSISMGNVRKIKQLLPDIDEQNRIVNYLDKICTSIDMSILKKKSLIERLTAYKKSLIYEAVTGKLEV